MELLRLTLIVGLATTLAAETTRAAEWQQLSADDAGLFGGSAWAVTDDGSVVFGYADVVQDGGPSAHTPVRWIRQPNGSFVTDPLGEGATTLDLPRGTAIDTSSDGTAAALYGLSKWTEAGGIACGSFCPQENENTAITADGTRVASNSFLSPGPGQRALLWSDSDVDVIDEVTAPAFGQFHVWDLSADGTVAVGEYPGPSDVQPVIWTRIGANDWTQTLPGLPPGANAAIAYRVSDDGRYAIVHWSPTDYGNLGFASILWSAEGGYEDINASGCRPDALNADGAIAVGRCDTFLGRWSRDSGWEIFTSVPSFTAKDLSPDGRHAVGHGNFARWADLGPLEDPACANGIDDDGDGRIDFGTAQSNDSGCASATDLSEQDPTLPCDDGADNDGDTFTDYPADPVCREGAFPTEAAECQDGISNDADGNIDFDGGASHNGGVPLTLIDSQCRNKPWRNHERPDTCGLGAELPLVLGWLVWSRRRAASRPRD